MDDDEGTNVMVSGRSDWVLSGLVRHGAEFLHELGPNPLGPMNPFGADAR